MNNKVLVFRAHSRSTKHVGAARFKSDKGFVSRTSINSSPVKSIASGIIDAHSSYSRSFQRVHSGFYPRSGDKLSKRGQDEKVPGTNGDRDQQRKLVRIKKRIVD